jgi:pimeloyl-ACP methyl ester carboxylesterase
MKLSTFRLSGLFLLAFAWSACSQSNSAPVADIAQVVYYDHRGHGRSDRRPAV